MNYIVFDLEWNQAADMKTRLKNELMFEIIEIGAVKLDSRKNYVDCFHELIKPQIFHEMNQITGQLTSVPPIPRYPCACSGTTSLVSFNINSSIIDCTSEMGIA